jgi:hypothetical protein
MATLKELREIACNPVIVARMERINALDRSMLSKTQYEQAAARAEIIQLSKEVQEILKNH